MTDKIGSLRRGQLVAASGPGALIDMRAANGAPISALVKGLDSWDKAKCALLAEPSLQRRLGNRELREPPVSIRDRNKNQPFVPAVRFPKWLECPRCRSLRPESRWREAGAGRVCRCSGEETFVVPAQLLRACRHGHLDEFEWDRWVRHRDGCTAAELYLRASGAGMRDLYLSCRTCKAGRSLNDAFVSRIDCTGNRPWLGADAREECGERMETLQRGASNVYYAATLSALSIPPWTDEFREKIADPGHWERIVEAVDEYGEDPEDLEEELDRIARRISRKSGEPPSIRLDEARRLVEFYSKAYVEIPAADDDAGLRVAEWHAIRLAATKNFADATFEVRDEPVPQALAGHVEMIARLPRLREVRVLTGFTRIVPANGGKSARLARNAQWLPAIETFGEGIFVALRSEAVAAWASDEHVLARAAALDAGWRENGGAAALTERITPRRLLVHAFSHALMARLSLACGYSAASLRERLYFAEDPAMAGVLIYTAAADADGTLGGLEREGRSERLGRTIRAAIEAMRWCSSDPLCLAGIATTTDPSNGAACHSCLMVPETSCETFNRFLDRAVLVGADDVPSGGRLPGFFAGLLRAGG